jgi:subtilisin family serine protease
VISVVPGTSTNGDPIGHGTGESANVFAAAPGAKLQPVRVSDNGGNLVGAVAGFLKAKELQSQIITCSWGGDEPFPPDDGPSATDQAFALEIQHAIESGICVIFSAGNGQFSIEPQVPGVLAAGGVFMNPMADLIASNYASGYESPFFDGRIVPDVCGLVGMLPRAQYLMLPVPPGCELDDEESKPDDTDPQSDGTTANDGWALFSGTSAAAPQLAGAAAVLLGLNPNLTPAQIVEAFSKTAIDITVGNCHPRFNNVAKLGRDLATGFGLIDLAEAVKFVRTNFSPA